MPQVWLSKFRSKRGASQTLPEEKLQLRVPPMRKTLAILGLLIASAVSAQTKHPTILISDSSTCKTATYEIIQRIFQAKFPAQWYVVVSCSVKDWKDWSPTPDAKTAFSKGRFTFVWGKLFETGEAEEFLETEADKARRKQQ